MRDVIAEALTAMKSERAKLDAAIRALETTTGTVTPTSSVGLPMRMKDGKTQYEIAPGRWVGRARCSQLGIATGKPCKARSVASRLRMSESSKRRWAERKAQPVDDAIGNQAETRDLVPA